MESKTWPAPLTFKLVECIAVAVCIIKREAMELCPPVVRAVVVALVKAFVL